MDLCNGTEKGRLNKNSQAREVKVWFNNFLFTSNDRLVKEDVTLEASFIDDLGADSLDIVELIMAMEEEFDIEISEEDAESISTVGSAIEYIKERQ